MQSTGQTSTHASQPGQLSAFTTAKPFGSFFLAFPAPFAIDALLLGDRPHSNKSAAGWGSPAHCLTTCQLTRRSFAAKAQRFLQASVRLKPDLRRVDS